MLDNPYGGFEDVQEIRSAGVEWLALNIGDYSPNEWLIIRQRAAVTTPTPVKVIPWARLARPDLGEDINVARQKLANIVNTGRLWNSFAILPNYEVEAESVAPPSLVGSYLKSLNWTGEIGWSTVAWLYNAVDYTPLPGKTVLLQIFPEDLHWTPDQIEQKVADCVYHARVDKDFDFVGLTYQNYRASPSWYDLSIPHSIFPGVPYGTWNQWF